MDNEKNNKQLNNKEVGVTPDKKSQDENLKKLSSQLSRGDDLKEEKKESTKKVIKIILISLLIAVLLGGIGLVVYAFAKSPTLITQAGTIKLSTQVTENIVDESGDLSISDTVIYPGEKFSVRCVISNSEEIEGDENGIIYNNIFVRFSLALEINGETYYDVVVPVIADLAKSSWHMYNPDEEPEDYEWDGYYYFYGSLEKNQRLTLFEEIEFDLHKTMNDFGGEPARIVIEIQAVHADIDSLGTEGDDPWNTAPRRWIENMQKDRNNYGDDLGFM